MTLYSKNNAAKQWILEQLSRRFVDRSATILDLACGSAWIWTTFIDRHPFVRIVGADTDAVAIAKGKGMYQGESRVDLRVADAQRPLEEGAYDAVIALSAIEHVVDRKAFLETVFRALAIGGVAYLNYDDGHFRSTNWKERVMVPVSQFLAMMGVEGPYMKRVNDAEFQRMAQEVGFRVIGLRLHNIAPLKGLLKDADDESVAAWYAFEELLGARLPAERLRSHAYSATLVLEKV